MTDRSKFLLCQHFQKCQTLMKNMADAAAARREARRKRILENSHNRLELIAGKKSSGDCSRESSSKCSYSDQIYESPADSSSRSSAYIEPVNNGVLSPEPEPYTLLSEPYNTNPTGDTEVANDFAGFTIPSTENIKEKSRLEYLVTYKYDVAILAIIIQLLYNLFIFETTYFFLPLIMYTVTKLIWFPAPSNFNFASAVLLMNGISASKAQKIMNIVQWLGAISQDICVYLFTTICIQSFFIAITTITDQPVNT